MRNPESLLSVALVGFLLICSGCAGLPRVSKVIQETPPDQESLEIRSAKGFLSPRQSQALIERLKRTVDPTDLLERQIGVMESVAGGLLIRGNRVRLLIDGPATYAAMFESVKSAKDHINIETFIFQDDETGRKFADLLLKKQSEGVRVNLIYDSVGSFSTPGSFFSRLRDGGIQVLEFNPANPLKAHGRWRLIRRDHRKILIADGKVAITGGINISEVYSGGVSGGEREEGEAIPWRDTDVQIEGPAVAEFQKLFFETWRDQKGPAISGGNYYPELKEVGNDLVQVIGSTPGEMNRTTFIMYVSAITFSDNFVHLTNAYFVPDEQMIKALTEAPTN